MKKCGTCAWARRGSISGLIAASLIVMGCGGGGGGGGNTNASAPPPSSVPPIGQRPSDGPTNKPPIIDAEPRLEITAGAEYVLAPTAKDPDGDTLAFSIQNRPEWARFSTVTGELRGTPVHAGTYADVTISVSDGTKTAALPAFTLAVSNPGVASDKLVTLEWELPALAADGSLLGELAGFRIHYGRKKSALTETIDVKNPGIVTYVIDDLPAGKYYFAVRAVGVQGAQSALSNVIEKKIG